MPRYLFLLLLAIASAGVGAELGLGPAPLTAGAIAATFSGDGTVSSSGVLTLTNGSGTRTHLGLGSAAILAAGGASGAATTDASSLLTFSQMPTCHRLIASDCSAHAIATGTSETVLKTFSFTAASLPTIGANSDIIVRAVWSCTSSANTKNMRVRLGASGAGTGGTQLSNLSGTTIAAAARDTVIFVRGASSQVAFIASQAFHEGTGAGAVATAAINLASDWEIALTGTPGANGETVQLEAASVEIITP